MTTKYVLLSAALTIALTSPLFGRDNLADTTKADMKRDDRSDMMGKPTADASTGGLQMKVWLMTEAQHKEMTKEEMGPMPIYSEQDGEIGKMDGVGLNSTSVVMVKEMKGLQHNGMVRKDTSKTTDIDTVEAIQATRSKTKAAVDSTTASTHYLVLDVTEIASGKGIAGASARLLIESPSKKSSSVDLKSMMEHFGSALTLDEKGEYRFTVNVSFGGVTKTTQFQYAVK
jgi:hypothetical protein